MPSLAKDRDENSILSKITKDEIEKAKYDLKICQKLEAFIQRFHDLVQEAYSVEPILKKINLNNALAEQTNGKFRDRYFIVVAMFSRLDLILANKELVDKQKELFMDCLAPIKTNAEFLVKAEKSYYMDLKAEKKEHDKKNKEKNKKGLQIGDGITDIIGLGQDLAISEAINSNKKMHEMDKKRGSGNTKLNLMGTKKGIETKARSYKTQIIKDLDMIEDYFGSREDSYRKAHEMLKEFQEKLNKDGWDDGTSINFTVEHVNKKGIADNEFDTNANPNNEVDRNSIPPLLQKSGISFRQPSLRFDNVQSVPKDKTGFVDDQNFTSSFDKYSKNFLELDVQIKNIIRINEIKDVPLPEKPKELPGNNTADSNKFFLTLTKEQRLNAAMYWVNKNKLDPKWKDSYEKMHLAKEYSEVTNLIIKYIKKFNKTVTEIFNEYNDFNKCIAEGNSLRLTPDKNASARGSIKGSENDNVGSNFLISTLNFLKSLIDQVLDSLDPNLELVDSLKASKRNAFVSLVSKTKDLEILKTGDFEHQEKIYDKLVNALVKAYKEEVEYKKYYAGYQDGLAKFEKNSSVANLNNFSEKGLKNKKKVASDTRDEFLNMLNHFIPDKNGNSSIDSTKDLLGLDALQSFETSIITLFIHQSVMLKNNIEGANRCIQMIKSKRNEMNIQPCFRQPIEIHLINLEQQIAFLNQNKKSTRGFIENTIEMRHDIPAPIQAVRDWFESNQTNYNQEGLFRVQGSEKTIAKIIEEMDRGIYDISSMDHLCGADGHVPQNVSGVLKKYLKYLPEGLIHTTLEYYLMYPERSQDPAYYHMIDSSQPETSAQALREYRKKCLNGELENIDCYTHQSKKYKNLKGILQYLLLFLNKVSKYSNTNKMAASNLAIVFVPTVFHSVRETIMPDHGLNVLLEDLIENCCWYFDVIDTDEGNEFLDEFDEPENVPLAPKDTVKYDSRPERVSQRPIEAPKEKLII